MSNRPLSVRADDETIKKFDEIAENANLPKSELFPLLLNLWETSKLKEALPGRTDEIDSFSSSLKHIDAVYRSSLSMAVNAKREAKAEIQKELDSFKITIQDLQEKNAMLGQKVEGLTNENANLTAEIERLQGQISDKDVMIKTLEAQQKDAETAKSVIAEFQNLLLDFRKVQEEKTKNEKKAK